jgi:hypothetical protein
MARTTFSLRLDPNDRRLAEELRRSLGERSIGALVRRLVNEKAGAVGLTVAQATAAPSKQAA